VRRSAPRTGRPPQPGGGHCGRPRACSHGHGRPAGSRTVRSPALVNPPDRCSHGRTSASGRRGHRTCLPDNRSPGTLAQRTPATAAGCRRAVRQPSWPDSGLPAVSAPLGPYYRTGSGGSAPLPPPSAQCGRRGPAATTPPTGAGRGIGSCDRRCPPAGLREVARERMADTSCTTATGPESVSSASHGRINPNTAAT
jgi:hypothetical protein